MFTVGATIGRPQTTAKPKRATNGRPYKQISAEETSSLPIFCVCKFYVKDNTLNARTPFIVGRGFISRRFIILYRLFSAAASHRPTIFSAGKICFTEGTRLGAFLISKRTYF